MKKNILSLLAVCAFFAVCFGVYSFCWSCNTEEPKTRYTPVYLTRDELNVSVKLQSPQELRKTGKIYLKDNFIFVNEKFKGIHVIDNANPTQPNNIGFISVPGCIDMAAKGHIIYADNAVDLVAIDITNPAAIKITKRIEYVFPDLIPPDGLDFKYDSTKGIIVEWK